MKTKSLVGPSLTLIFCLAAYIVYVFSIMQNNKNWIAIAALIYFLPIFVDFIEDFESTFIEQKNVFYIFIGCIIAGVAYLAVLLSYLALVEDGISETAMFIFKLFLVVVPVVCLPIKAYPVAMGLMQKYKRLFPRG